MDMTVLKSSLQPAERVREYLEQDFLSKADLYAEKETRLPTAEEIAVHLGVSTRTVQKVVGKLVGEGLLQTIQGKGTFIRKPEEPKRNSLMIGTNMLVFNPDHCLNWSETIYLGAVRMAAAMRRNISVMPVASSGPTPVQPENIYQELLQQIDQIDMLMLFGDKKNADLCRVYEEAGKPVVTINPPAIGATSNFVSADYFEAGYRAGHGLYHSGRRNFLSIAPLHFVVSQNLLRHGFVTGCRRDLDPGVHFRMMESTPDGQFSPALRNELRDLFSAPGPKPDAIFCMSDFMAEQIQDLLAELGLCVPDDVSILSGTGLPSTSLSNPGLTRIMQPMDQIGANAVRMLCHRHDNQNQLVPGLFLRAPIHAGNTTRPEENLQFARKDLQPGQ